MHHIYMCVRGMCGETLVGRNLKGTEILMSMSLPMKKLDFGKQANQKIMLCCALWVLPSQQNPRVLLGNCLGLHLRWNSVICCVL